MKKLFLVTLIAAFSLSCSSNDDIPLDSIVGSWDFSGVSITYKDGTQKQVEVNECFQYLYMFANKNGGYALDIPIYDADFGDCYIRIRTSKGNWQKLSENLYHVEMQFYYITPYLPEPGEYYEEGEASFNLDVSFPDSKTMYVHNQDLLGYYPEEVLDEDVVSFSIIYKKPH